MSERRVEYAVFDRTAQRLAGGGTAFDSEAEAAHHICWLELQRKEIKARADANETSGFEGGNADWWAFYRTDWKDADWIVVSRTVTPWRPVDTP